MTDLMVRFLELIQMFAGGWEMTISIGGFFSTFADDMVTMAKAKDYLSILIDWRVLVIVGVLLFFAVYTRSKVVFLVLFSMYGISVLHRYIAGPDSDVGTDTLANVDNIVLLVVGVLGIAVVVIYFAMIRGD